MVVNKARPMVRGHAFPCELTVFDTDGWVAAYKNLFTNPS